MTFRGVVKEGKVILDDPEAIPEGSRVEVQRLTGVAAKRRSGKETSRTKTSRKGVRSKKSKSFLEVAGRFAGVFTDLPADSSRNIDHYLYGAPKR